MEEEKQIRDICPAEQYRDMLYRIAFSSLKNRADAEDAVQETFLRLMRSEPEFRNGEHEKAWLIRTVLHVSTDIMKNAWNKRTVGLDGQTERDAQGGYFPFSEEDETRGIVMRLPAHYKNALYLFYYEDYSIQEISLLLKEKESTIKTRLRRGREEVKKELEKRREQGED